MEKKAKIKKVNLFGRVRPEIREFVNYIADDYGRSVSEYLDEWIEESHKQKFNYWMKHVRGKTKKSTGPKVDRTKKKLSKSA